MKTAVMPGFSELIIIANPVKEVTREGLLNIIMPWLYAPWPDAQKKGVIDMEVPGDTLRALLIELSRRYQQANVDFVPLAPKADQVDVDYEVTVNDKNYLSLTTGLDTKLKAGDKVKVKMMWRWDG